MRAFLCPIVSMTRHRTLGALALLGSSTSPGLAQAPTFDQAVYAWQLPVAGSLVDPTATDPESARQRGVLAFHRGDYAKAIKHFEQILGKPGTSKKNRAPLPPNVTASVHALLSKSKAAKALFGASDVVKSPSGHFTVQFANPKDQVLSPYLFDALARANPILESAIGVKAPGPVRFEFIRKPADLAQITDLPLDAVYKTGTIGITKYHRVMMASPRVTIHGYDWLDTAVHEYVHYLVSIRTRNKAPVWLQEGLAKFFEQSWRHQGPPKISKTQASLLDDAQREDRWITIDQMHPSIALLPSQSDAALAYAQVQTMIAHLQRTHGNAAIAQVLAAVSRGQKAKAAFSQAYGRDWNTFVRDWKRDLKTRLAKSSKQSFKPQRFATGERPGLDELAPDAFSRLRAGPSRKHARLGVLLAERGHDRAAIAQFERAIRFAPELSQDPKLARRLGRLYLDNEQSARALGFLQKAAQSAPQDAYLATLEAMAALDSKRTQLAQSAALRALAQNPMIPQLHCVLAQLERDPKRQQHEQRYCQTNEPGSNELDDHPPPPAP